MEADSQHDEQTGRKGAVWAAIPALLIWLLALFTLALHAREHVPFQPDDTLISLRYADRLLAGQGLTWTDGEWVEGYSNLLWVLGCALLGALGMDLVVAARLLGFASMGAAIGALVFYARPHSLRESLPAVTGALAMTVCGSIAIWSIAGLEQPLMIGLIGWALALIAPLLDRGRGEPIGARELIVPGLLLGLACWTRPDAPLFLACACATLWLARGAGRGGLRSALVLAIPAILLIGAQLAFRLAYYGDWVPNTAHAKVAFSAQRARQGWLYWWQGVWPLAGIALPALAQLLIGLRSPQRRARALLFGLPLLAWSAWVVAIGGDVFAGRRHLVVVVLLMAFLAVDFWRTCWRGASKRMQPGIAAAAAGSLALLLWMQWNLDPSYRLTGLQVGQAQKGESLGRMLGAAFAEQQPLVAMTAAGALPYYSKLPSLDMLGLNDRYLAHHPPATLGQGRVAHELGDGQYFIRRAPDLVVFCGRRGRVKACSRGGIEMQADPSFERDYTLVAFRGMDPVRVRGQVWARHQSPAIGVRVSADGSQVEIPGFLFTGGRPVTAILNNRGQLVANIAAGKRASFAQLSLPPGRWRVEAQANGTAERIVSLHDGGEELARAGGSEPLDFELPRHTRVEVSLLADDSPVELSRLQLQRLTTTPSG